MTVEKLEDKVRIAVDPVKRFYRQNGLGLYRSELATSHNKYPYHFQWLVEKDERFDNKLIELIAQYLALEEAKLGKEVVWIVITRANAIADAFEDTLDVVFSVDIELDVRFND